MEQNAVNKRSLILALAGVSIGCNLIAMILSGSFINILSLVWPVAWLGYIIKARDGIKSVKPFYIIMIIMAVAALFGVISQISTISILPSSFAGRGVISIIFSGAQSILLFLAAHKLKAGDKDYKIIRGALGLNVAANVGLFAFTIFSGGGLAVYGPISMVGQCFFNASIWVFFQNNLLPEYNNTDKQEMTQEEIRELREKLENESHMCSDCGERITGKDAVCPVCGASNPYFVETVLTAAKNAKSDENLAKKAQASRKRKYFLSATLIAIGIVLDGLSFVLMFTLNASPVLWALAGAGIIPFIIGIKMYFRVR